MQRVICMIDMKDIIQVKHIKHVTPKKTKRSRTNGGSMSTNSNKDNMSSSIKLHISSYDLNKHFVHRIQEFNIKDDLKKMNGGKMMGLDGISIEV
jgi:hypothetical protein